ncbi:MAG: hypothetical protein HC821_00060 [Lewinella sp.]|nr:hypothetical protein [Lewinella sp.]
MPPDQQGQATRWGAFLLRSLVANAGGYLVNGPERLLNLNSGGSSLFQQTGGVLLEYLLLDPDRLDLASGLSRAAMDQLWETTLAVVAEHPSLIDGAEASTKSSAA